MVVTKNSNLEDQAWYVDNGANTQMTARLDNLSNQEPYQGYESVALRNDSFLPILHSSSCIVHIPTPLFTLNNIFHCPKASVNLRSIQKL